MKLFKIMGLCFVAAMALSAVVSASASATKNPKWALCETRGPNNGQWGNASCTELGGNKSHETRLLLTENETRVITAVANGVQKLSSSTVTILCQTLKLASSSKLIGGEPAGDLEIIIYEECTVEGHTKCKVRSKGAAFGTIETKDLKSLIGYKTEAAEIAENLGETVTVFKPETGSTFVILEMETECPSSKLEKIELPVIGEVVCENIGNEHLVTHEINCPATAQKTYWLQSGGSPKEEKIAKMELGGVASTYTGKSKISLGGSQLGQAFWMG